MPQVPLHPNEHPSDSDAPETAAGELARRCSLCHASIGGEFYTLRRLTVCPRCTETFRHQQQSPGTPKRAALFGLLATAVCAIGWLLLVRATGHTMPWLAIPVGIVVGLSLHQGSRGRGGFRYQVAAALLVYAAFVVPFVPPVFGGVADAIKKQHAEEIAVRTDKPAASQNTPPVPEGMPTTTSSASTSAAMPARPSPLASIKAYFVFAVIAWGLVLVSPFVQGAAGALGTLSLAIGMAVAWHLNRRARLRGPHAPTT
jgi:hypothetical protein